MQKRMRQDNEFIAELSARKHSTEATDADPEQCVTSFFFTLFLC